MSGTSKIRTILSNVSISLASIALCLLAIEVFFVVRHESVISELEKGRGERELCTLSSPIPDLIYTGKPGKCGKNSRGYRDRERSFDKSEGIFRVVVIGDSVASGHGVPIENSVASLLEEDLNQTASGEGTVEVVNLSVTGYSTSQQLIVLEREAFRYKPDLIIWSYVLNDPFHPVYHNPNGEIGLYHYRPSWHAAHFVDKKLFLIREKFRKKNCYGNEIHLSKHCIYREEIKANIQQIGRIAAAEGVPILFVIHPVFDREGGFSPYFLATVHEELADFASTAGLSVLDLTDTYAHHDPGELAFPMLKGYDPWHPNEKGHAIAAEALFTQIVQAPVFKLWLEEHK